jgi:hypothetical protein
MVTLNQFCWQMQTVAKEFASAATAGLRQPRLFRLKRLKRSLIAALYTEINLMPNFTNLWVS